MQKSVIWWVSQSKQRSHRLIFTLGMTSKFFHRTAEQQLKLHWRHDNISFSNAVVCFFQCVDICFARWPKIFTLRTFMRNTPNIGIFHGGNASLWEIAFALLNTHVQARCKWNVHFIKRICHKERVRPKPARMCGCSFNFFLIFLLSTPSECNKLRKIP